MKIISNSVVYDLKFEADLHSSDGEEVLGITNFGTCEVSIESAVNIQTMKLSILHEVCHLFLGVFAESHDETVIRVLASGLYGFLKNNKVLVEWIMSDSNKVLFKESSKANPQ